MFCKRVKADLKRKIHEVGRLEMNIDDLQLQLSNKKGIINAYKLDIQSEKENTIRAVHNERLRTTQAKLKLIKSLDTLNITYIRLNDCLNTPAPDPEIILVNPFPDVSKYMDDVQIYEPFKDKRLNPYDVNIADAQYNMMSRNDWKGMLKLVHVEVKKAQKIWKKSVGDCDNWAESMHYFLSKSVLNTGVDLQCAFAIAWSKTHAYNIFIANDDIWMYEPQSGKTKGRMIGKYGEMFPNFATERIFFIS